MRKSESKFKQKKCFKFRVLGLFFALCCIFTFSIGSFNCVELKATEGEIVEEENPETTPEIPEEEPELGFFERNLEDIIASAIGVLGAIAAFFVLVAKAKKSVIDTLEAFKGGKISSEEAMKQIVEQKENLEKAKNEIFEQLEIGKNQLLKTAENLEKYVEESKEFTKEMLESYKQEIAEIKEGFESLKEAFILMVNNNEELVKKGISEKINNTLEGELKNEESKL